jgi:hypothetical protein
MTRWILALLALVVGTLTAVARVDPRWTREVGLDFWNLADATAWRRAEEARTQELTALLEQGRQRREVLNSIAARLVGGQINLTQASEEVERLAATDDEWFATLADAFGYGEVSTREVTARFLLTRVRTQVRAAEQSGQHAQAALVAARLAELEAESRPPAASAPPPRSPRR